MASTDVFEDFFNKVFGAAVRVRNALPGRHGFKTFRGLLGAIDGGGAAKNQAICFMFEHAFDDIERANDIVVMIFVRLGLRLADGF